MVVRVKEEATSAGTAIGTTSVDTVVGAHVPIRGGTLVNIYTGCEREQCQRKRFRGISIKP